MAKDPKKLKLLIITQKVDINDDILGFFHGWIKKLAEKIDRLDVICLYKGKYDLPNNVQVYSLGKEENGNRLKYLWRLYKYAWKLLSRDDLLFVHMNHKYVLLLWPLVKIFRKPIVLWKTHRGMQKSLKKAIKLVNKVLTASELSLDYSGKKKKVVGHGIDTNTFSLKPYADNKIKKIVLVGRISPIKNQHILVEIANWLINKLKVADVKFEIIGSPKVQKDFTYFKKVKKLIEKYNLGDYFNFRGKIPNQKMSKTYSDSEILVDLAQDAGLDKAPLEAMSRGRIILASQPALQNSLNNYKKDLSINLKISEGIARKIKKYLELKKEKKEEIGKELRRIVVKNHSLDNLTDKLIHIFTSLV